MGVNVCVYVCIYRGKLCECVKILYTDRESYCIATYIYRERKYVSKYMYV